MVVLEHVRGTLATILAYVAKGGEFVFCTDDLSVRVGDGALAGGWTIGGKPVVSVTGTSHTVTGAEQGHLFITSNASAVAFTLPQAVTANNFGNGQGFVILVEGAGTVTLTPTTSTINGAASLSIVQGQGAHVYSDGTNYYAVTGTTGGGGSGTVTSVGLSVPGSSLFGVTGSPVTTSGVLGLTTTGTSGGIPYFSSTSALSSSALLSANNPVIGGGAGTAPSSGARSGNTTTFGTTSGALTNGDVAKFDVNGNIVDGGVAFAPASLAADDILIYVAGTGFVNHRPRYVIGASTAGVLTNSQNLLLHRFAVGVTIPANFGAYLNWNSQAGGTANATGSTVINVDKAASATPNTFSNIGTITIAAGTVTPTFATSGGTAQTFAAGDVLRLQGPASADATFAGFYATLVGYET